jgi:hypothetical protein
MLILTVMVMVRSSEFASVKLHMWMLCISGHCLKIDW